MRPAPKQSPAIDPTSRIPTKAVDGRDYRSRRADDEGALGDHPLVPPAAGAGAVHARVHAEDVVGADPLGGEGDGLDRGIVALDGLAEGRRAALPEGSRVEDCRNVRRDVDRQAGDADDVLDVAEGEVLQDLLADLRVLGREAADGGAG